MSFLHTSINYLQLYMHFTYTISFELQLSWNVFHNYACNYSCVAIVMCNCVNAAMHVCIILGCARGCRFSYIQTLKAITVQRESLANLANRLWCTKLTQYLQLITYLADLLICQTFFRQLLKKVNSPNFSTIRHTHVGESNVPA